MFWKFYHVVLLSKLCAMIIGLNLMSFEMSRACLTELYIVLRYA